MKEKERSNWTSSKLPVYAWMCLIIGCVLSNMLTAGFPAGWVESRGFLRSFLLFWHLYQLGTFTGKAPYLHEREEDLCQCEVWDTITETKWKQGWAVCRKKSEFCRGKKPRSKPFKRPTEDHMAVVKCRAGSHTSPDSDRAPQVKIFWSGPDPVQIQSSPALQRRSTDGRKRSFGENGFLFWVISVAWPEVAFNEKGFSVMCALLFFFFFYNSRNFFLAVFFSLGRRGISRGVQGMISVLDGRTSFSFLVPFREQGGCFGRGARTRCWSQTAPCHLDTSRAAGRTCYGRDGAGRCWGFGNMGRGRNGWKQQVGWGTEKLAMLGYELIGNSWALGKGYFWSLGLLWNSSSQQKEKSMYNTALWLWLHVIFDPRYHYDLIHFESRR